MHYKKYRVRSPLFTLRDPRLCAEVLAAFAAPLSRRLAPPPRLPAGPRRGRSKDKA